ncbi:MAG: hypothetical protein ABIJ61_00050 [bacterium]
MSRIKSTVLILAALLLLSVACSEENKPTDPGDLDPFADLNSMLDQTPRADEEAEVLALWLTGSLVAPESTYQRVHDDLNEIRNLWSDSITEVGEINFSCPFSPGIIQFDMSDSAIQQLRLGTFREFDSLNALYRVRTIDSTRWWALGRTALFFEGRLYTDSVIAIYSSVPGLSNVYGGAASRRWTNVYLWRSAAEMNYLFCNLLEEFCYFPECEADFWYFRSSMAEVELVEAYHFDGVFDTGLLPEWWRDAIQPICKYHRLDEDYCE